MSASELDTTKSFQNLILKLQNYWAEKGCAITQPFDMEVGAGTFHPATFLRSIGPEPWKAAYVQSSRRPSDGRYGENPNRLLSHGKRHMFSLQEDQVMVAMERTQTAFSTIINFRFY